MAKKSGVYGLVGAAVVLGAALVYAQSPHPETKCDNGRDDDRDDLTDCDDPDCDADPACAGCVPTEDPEVTCGDSLDGDCDGQVDCDDSDCDGDPLCASCVPSEEPEATCDDGLDGDCDGQVDCDDSDCDGDPLCISCVPSEDPEVTCDDGLDGDCDGLVDCDDADCAGVAGCETTGTDYALIAWNDLGMHCVCPNPELMLLLPPWNTLRAQVIDKTSGSPVVTNDDSRLQIEYEVRENAYGGGGVGDLATDSQYLAWLDSAEAHFPGSGISRANPVGLAGNALAGTFSPRDMVGQHDVAHYWVAEGIPAFPPRVDSDPDFVDSYGDGRRAYLHADLKLRDQATGDILATTTTTIPVANGRCCQCHQEVARDGGYVKSGAADPDVYDRFQSMMDAHVQDTGVDPLNDIAGPTYDAQGHLIATAVPVRCSKCHVDPALGGDAALDPAWVAYGKAAGSVTEISTLSKALHGFHGTDARVEARDPSIDTNCYQCHPGGNGKVDCFRGLHHTASFDCADCHGNLDQRLAEGQLDNPWHYSTLPQCGDCHTSRYAGGGTPDIFGTYLGSQGHKKEQLLCSTCHGQPHALNPSEHPTDNEQTLALQGDPRAIGKCDVCHVSKSSTWGEPPH